jgi:hypothetical protein
MMLRASGMVRLDVFVFGSPNVIFPPMSVADPASDLYHEWADDFNWDDYLTEAVLAIGHDDLSNSIGMLDSPSSVDYIREQLKGAWVGISAVAKQLVSDQTVSGRDAWQLLTLASLRSSRRLLPR